MHGLTTLTDIVADAERQLDRLGLKRAHLVGHSMGGYTAIELARRGRAATVTAFSPGGFWSAGDGTVPIIVHGVRRSVRLARFGRPVIKAWVSSPRGRRVLMGAAVHRPDSMTAGQARAVIDDQAGCSLGPHLFVAENEIVDLLDPLPCPVTVAWGEHDRVLPLAFYAKAARERLPGASFIVMPGVGHAAIVDDHDLVIRTILDVTLRH